MKNIAILTFTFVCISGIFAQDYEQFTSYKASDPNIQIIGRYLLNENGDVEFDWPGVSIKANFEGRACAIQIDDTKKNFYNVFIDDEFINVVEVYSDTTLILAAKLCKGDHSLLITKRTEGNQGKATFKGLLIDKKGLLKSPPEKFERKIEFIGNSITCGYGTEAEKRDDPFKAETENNYKSYAPITARAFNAEAHIIAHSGQGVVRNYGHDKTESEYNMPDRYLQLFDSQKEPLWDFSKWIPDMVVINLGTNDYSTQPHPSEELFTKGYENLISDVRVRYGSIPVFCIVGPMTNEPCYSYVKRMVERIRNDEKDYNVYFIGIPNYLLADEDWGAYHPKYSGQIKMAGHVVPVIGSVMGWGFEMKD